MGEISKNGVMKNTGISPSAAALWVFSQAQKVRANWLMDVAWMDTICLIHTTMNAACPLFACLLCCVIRHSSFVIVQP